ncbi:EAL domain-containing protein [Lacticaseibacillus brantae]|uniref:Diguanylate cyclase phosphodiesterase domain-containing protein n=1 Tax=Lacticaseibacillus brantae DSM 23927 TaxID=1423727 RepID=A0A0R2AW21_9LACO|nr:EAL domain-containing protein [Lacticaseibacillus brantae]KRM71175.1 diguanylate cyclase phosphodiesterase domain-containing protein [Lacticaseibacillus brantae DSM 23927]
MLRELTTFLLWVTLVLVLIAGGTIAIFFYQSRRRSRNYLAKNESELRYFIQQQVDSHGEITGYECLLRQEDESGHWRLPMHMETLPLQRVIFLLDGVFVNLPKVPYTLAINLEYEQIISPEFDYFVRWAQSRIAPMKLVIELTVNPDARYRQHRRFLRQVAAARAYGAEFAIDNVGNRQVDLKAIEWMLPQTDLIKASMRQFRKEDGQWLDLNLQFWRRLAEDHQIDLMLIGVEDDQDVELAKLLNITHLQGYRYGRPVDVSEQTEDKLEQ